jgi:glycosyltransferase involved in cell wall biosynthesis
MLAAGGTWAPLSCGRILTAMKHPTHSEVGVTSPPILGPGSISGVVVARNEEPVIRRCLESLRGVVDEMVFVHDGPCGDRTLDIAQEFGARIFVREATGNPEAHTVFAYEQARGDWLLNIDADEFLSSELRSALPVLVGQETVAGYQFLWRFWDGHRYITEKGPYKLALHRRAATRLLGMLQSNEKIDGVVERVPIPLEHRPLYNNFAARVVLTKWRRWAKIHANELTGPFSELPKFNWVGPWDWPWWRRPLNAAVPVLLVPYLGAMFVKVARAQPEELSHRERLRIAFLSTCYAALVQLYVIKEVYGGLVSRAAGTSHAET